MDEKSIYKDRERGRLRRMRLEDSEMVFKNTWKIILRLWT